MSDKQQQDMIFNEITTALGDQITWRWDEQQSALLTEFSWEKKEKMLSVLRQLFSEEWHRKSIKKAPKTLKAELGDLAKLTKEQLIFSRPATDKTPALALIWWPWGHGGTYSMRLLALHTNYDDEALQQAQKSTLLNIFQRFSG